MYQRDCIHDSQADGCTQLCHNVEHRSGESMCLGRKYVNDDEVSDGEYDCTKRFSSVAVLVCSVTSDVPSIETALSSMDQKSVNQYGHIGSVSANRSGEAVAITDADVTRTSARMYCTKNPVETLSTSPMAIPGRKRRDAWLEERPCIFWKL